MDPTVRGFAFNLTAFQNGYMENKESFNIRVDSNAPCGSSSSDFTSFTSTVTAQSMVHGLGSSSASSSGLERRRKNRGSSNERYVIYFPIHFVIIRD